MGTRAIKGIWGKIRNSGCKRVLFHRYLAVSNFSTFPAFFWDFLNQKIPLDHEKSSRKCIKMFLLNCAKKYIDTPSFVFWHFNNLSQFDFKIVHFLKIYHCFFSAWNQCLAFFSHWLEKRHRSDIFLRNNSQEKNIHICSHFERFCIFAFFRTFLNFFSMRKFLDSLIPLTPLCIFSWGTNVKRSRIFCGTIINSTS